MEQICPRCRTTSFQNPQLKLLVNVCGHRLCEQCVDAHFRHSSAACLECGRVLRRSEFRAQQFEDVLVEREIDVRKRVLREFNRRQEDFPTLRLYNDYLEEVEEIIYNISNGIDVDEMQARVERNRKENQRVIQKNRAWQDRELRALEHQLRTESELDEVQRQQTAAEEQQQHLARQKARLNVIDELMTSNCPDDVVRNHMRNLDEMRQRNEEPVVLAKPVVLATGEENFGFLPEREEEGKVYVYEAPTINVDGPLPPKIPAISEAGFAGHWRKLTPKEQAGGFAMDIGVSRALYDAFSGLFL